MGGFLGDVYFMSGDYYVWGWSSFVFGVGGGIDINMGFMTLSGTVAKVPTTTATAAIGKCMVIFTMRSQNHF